MRPINVMVTAFALLAGMYLGCAQAPQVLDPRVPAGNAQTAGGTAATAVPAAVPTPRGKGDATGYWLLEADKANSYCCAVGHLALKQKADGALLGEMDWTGSGPNKLNGKNDGGKLDFTLVNDSNTPLPLRFTGSIGEDGATVTLSNGSNADPKLIYTATRLF